MNANWTTEIPIDSPATPIHWSWSEREFGRNYPKPDHCKGPFVSLLGLGPLTCHGYAGASSPSLISRIYLHSVPQEIRTEIPLYETASDLLRRELGDPTYCEHSSFCLWPDHNRLWWAAGDLEVLLFIDDIFWNSMELMTIQIQRIDRSRHYSGWNPRAKQEAEKPHHPTANNRSVSMFSGNYNPNPVIDARSRW